MEAPFAPAHLLVAEDNSTNQILISALLNALGFTFKLVVDGQQAFEATQQNEFDLIIMDCQMPVMDGFEATRKIRENEITTKKHIPIIALTGNASEEDQKQCRESGMDHFLSKPVKRDALVNAIRPFLKLK